MAIEGSLTDVGLADISQLLALGRKTGCLTVTDQSNFGYIYFDNGQVVHASVLNRPDRLGELLVRSGVVKEDALARAVEEQAGEGGAPLGEILVRQGSLSKDELDRWITIQIEEAVYHLFTWSQGSFHFNPDEAPDKDTAFLVSLNADRLLMEGARRVDEWTLIEKKIPSMDLVFQVVRDPREQEGLELSNNQVTLLPLLDGSRSVQEMADESGLVEFETAKALFELLQAGFIQQVGAKDQPVQTRDELAVHRRITLGKAFFKAGMIEDASKEFGEALKGDEQEATARFYLGLLGLKGGQPGTALEHFDAMAQGDRSGYGVLRNRALALEQLGRFDEALGTLEEAEALGKGDASLLLAKAITQLKSGKPDAARVTFHRYRHELGIETPPPLYYSFGVLAAAMAGRLEEAIGLGREGLQIYPSEAAILVNTGAILVRKGDHEAAEQYFLRALSTGAKGPPQAHKNLGDQAYRRGDHRGARSHYQHAAALDPELGDDLFLRLGNLALQSKDGDGAIKYFRHALRLNPECGEAKVRLKELSPRG